MPKGAGQKLKLYYLSRIMLEKTDDEHMITMPEIKKALEAYGVTADRKSLYDDLQSLEVLGIEVLGEKIGHNYYYHVSSKQFEIAELKLLVDAIQCSRFISAKKSDALIKKLTGLVSKYEAEQLKRQVVVQGRIKSMNESIYYCVDDLHRAIAENRQISFEYMKWNLQKSLVSKRSEPYIVSPWALTWGDENYYLIAYDEEADRMKHFRVDKMKSICILQDKRIGRDRFKELDLAKYSQMNFDMFGGDETKFRLAFRDELGPLRPRHPHHPFFGKWLVRDLRGRRPERPLLRLALRPRHGRQGRRSGKCGGRDAGADRAGERVVLVLETVGT